ncbi:unnamed protein product [Rhizoctonia solani]|uniref:Uncharacterized protein n=1 Tax=Rhizoctonia solani TaxID=456999 RepID=A0A8H2XB25_9AGAM|nr:unnamed protein product [Rhizoctonia solani]
MLRPLDLAREQDIRFASRKSSSSMSHILRDPSTNIAQTLETCKIKARCCHTYRVWDTDLRRRSSVRRRRSENNAVAALPTLTNITGIALAATRAASITAVSARGQDMLAGPGLRAWLER